MTDLTASIHTYLTTAPASGFAGRAVTVRAHWQGDDNLLWRVDADSDAPDGDAVVVKLFLDAGQARGRRQFDGQQIFAPPRLAPAPLWFDRYPEGLARQVLVYRWVEGRAVDVSDAHDLTALAISVAAVHNHDASSVRRISPRAVSLDYFWRVLAGGLPPTVRWLEEANCPRLAELVRKLEATAAAVVGDALPLWQGASPTPVHGDLRLQNALIQGDRALLLDWEMFGLGDPALDAAALLFHEASALGAAGRASWLESYCAYCHSPDIVERIDIYSRLLPLQHFADLLGRLRQLTAAERRDPDFRNNTAFLRQTLTLAGEAATAHLLDAAAVPSDEIDHLLTDVTRNYED
jgi:Ser/Thr protein kinase RdoA (MazF antagonist)